jgi:hypothetical protein
VNRHEVEKRLRDVEAKVKFMMHTLALTRKDNETGKADSRTFETLFETAVANDMDSAKVEEVAGDSGDGVRNRQAAPNGKRSGDGMRPTTGTISQAGPDGFPK